MREEGEERGERREAGGELQYYVVHRIMIIKQEGLVVDSRGPLYELTIFLSGLSKRSGQMHCHSSHDCRQRNTSHVADEFQRRHPQKYPASVRRYQISV